MRMHSSEMAGAIPAPTAQSYEADLAACRVLLANGSRTFLAASYLLPRDVRHAACALYAFCRVADDAVDLSVDPASAVRMLRLRLDGVYAGTPADEVADRALCGVVRRHAIPRTLLDALIEGFEWDAQGRSYQAIEDLECYAARVAGTVGAMMALLMGVRSEAAVARACDLGVAMQLSNIARDVGEDARMGRVYLPRRWMADAGIDADAWLADPHFTPALATVVHRLLDHADALYARVDAGVALLPLSCRPGINAARFLYASIGHEVARAGFDSVSRRAVVPGRRKLRQLVRAVANLQPDDAARALPALAATRHLVEAVQQEPTPAPLESIRAGAYERALWVLDLFERLEQRDRGAGGSTAAA